MCMSVSGGGEADYRRKVTEHFQLVTEVVFVFNEEKKTKTNILSFLHLFSKCRNLLLPWSAPSGLKVPGVT